MKRSTNSVANLAAFSGSILWVKNSILKDSEGFRSPLFIPSPTEYTCTSLTLIKQIES